MSAAYVFIQTGAADPHQILPKLRQVPGVKQSHALAGPTDFIAFIEGEDQSAMESIMMAIREIEGIASTDTRFVILD